MADKNTIGVTAKNAVVLDDLVQDGKFADQMQAARFAMSVAIEDGVGPGSVEGATTKWNVGSFDQDGEVATLLRALYPDEPPYRMLEYLIDSGLTRLGEEKERRGYIDPIERLEFRSQDDESR
jgi:hypothetical protein